MNFKYYKYSREIKPKLIKDPLELPLMMFDLPLG